MSHRYFVDSPIMGSKATLTGAEAHHLLRVMRATTGTEVVLFDGTGVEFRCCVDRAGRSRADLTVLARAEVNRELPASLVLGVGLPKANRQRWLVEKAVELGVTRLVPLEMQRSVVHVDPAALGRLRRTVIEASKQCGRNCLMQIDPPCAWAQFVGTARAGATSRNVLRWVADPGRPPLDLRKPPTQTTPITHVLLAIGPEGGLTDAETRIAHHAGWDLVGLGKRILRIETAALALATLAAQMLMVCPD